jgi:hypothetical protein
MYRLAETRYWPKGSAFVEAALHWGHDVRH